MIKLMYFMYCNLSVFPIRSLIQRDTFQNQEMGEIKNKVLISLQELHP